MAEYRVTLFRLRHGGRTYKWGDTLSTDETPYIQSKVKEGHLERLSSSKEKSTPQESKTPKGSKLQADESTDE